MCHLTFSCAMADMLTFDTARIPQIYRDAVTEGDEREDAQPSIHLREDWDRSRTVYHCSW